MNIVSTMVGLSVMGAAAPMLMDMAITPAVAQRRAINFGQAESAAVVFASKYEGRDAVPVNTNSCTATEIQPRAYTVTCKAGEGQFETGVTRAFRLMPQLVCDDNDGNNGHGNSGGYDCSNPGNGNGNGNKWSTREFLHDTPTKFSGHQCPTYDAWGVNGYNDTWSDHTGGACIPAPIWTQASYNASSPDAWLYDVNNYNGWGNHPDY